MVALPCVRLSKVRMLIRFYDIFIYSFDLIDHIRSGYFNFNKIMKPINHNIGLKGHKTCLAMVSNGNREATKKRE
jgi:hypothetical protein